MHASFKGGFVLFCVVLFLFLFLFVWLGLCVCVCGGGGGEGGVVLSAKRQLFPFCITVLKLHPVQLENVRENEANRFCFLLTL